MHEEEITWYPCSLYSVTAALISRACPSQFPGWVPNGPPSTRHNFRILEEFLVWGQPRSPKASPSCAQTPPSPQRDPSQICKHKHSFSWWPPMAAPPRVQSEPSLSFMTQGWWELCNRHSVNVFSSCFFQGSNCLIISLLAGQKPKRNDLTGQLGKWFVEILGPRKSLGPVPGWHPLEGSLTKERGAGSKRKARSRSRALEGKAPAARLQVKK